MDKVQLRNFVLLAQTLNYSTVAKQEFISQPALTKQVNRLEEELGVQLFHRSKHGVSLTYAGEEFYRHATEILDGINKAQQHMEHIRNGQAGALSIVSVFGLDDVLSQCVAAFIERYPEVHVDIASGTAAQQILSINKQAADVFFSYGQLLDMFPQVDTLPLPEDRFAVYLHRRDMEAVRRNGLSYLDRLVNLVEYRTESGPLFPEMIYAIREALGLKQGNIQYYTSNATILIAIQAGMGFAFLPENLNFGLCPDQVEKIPLQIPQAQILRSVGWYRSSRNPTAARFVEAAGQWIRARGGGPAADGEAGPEPGFGIDGADKP